MMAELDRSPHSETQPRDGHNVCPHLARCDDEQTFIGYPAPLNHCRRAVPHAAVSLHQQADYCLKPMHVECPVAAIEWSGRLPARMRTRWKRQKRRQLAPEARHWRLRILIPVLALCGLALLSVLLAQGIP